MANPLFHQLGGGRAQGGNMFQQFQQFMHANRGKDPNAMISQIVSSGQLTQEQLNIIQQRAGQIAGALDGAKGMFGF